MSRYVPAAGRAFLTPVYDRVVAMTPKGWVGNRLSVESRGAAVIPLDVRGG